MSSAGISSFDINATYKLSLVLFQFEEKAKKKIAMRMLTERNFISIIDTAIYLSKK
jgi:hypothetical protein